jgi:hypothetical protein
MARVRTRSRANGPGGYRKALAGGLVDQPGTPGSWLEYCSDVVNNRYGENPLLIYRVSDVKWWVTGLRTGWWDYTRFAQHGQNTNFSANESYANGIIASYASVPSNNDAYAKGLAMTNPNRPAVDLPVFIWELAEIPKMIYNWGAVLFRKPSFSGGKNLKDLPRATASRYLEYQFGILPFINDLQKILDFQAQVQKKMDLLERLDRPGGSVRSGTVFSVDDAYSSNSGLVYATPDYQEGRRFTYVDSCRRKMWVSTRWTPSIAIPRTVEDKRWLATRMAFGLDISFSTLWEAMPWSWLIDWFSNVGDILGAYRNTIPVTSSGSCLMDQLESHRKVVSIQLPVPTDSLVLDFPSPVFVRKLRTPMGSGPPQVSFNVPFLTGTQTAILGSLAVLKGTRF